MPRVLHTFVMTLLLGAACGGGQDDAHEHGHQGSGATCPTPQASSYDNFGRGFFASYCLRCHSRDKTGSARMAAPAALNYDTVADIRQASTAIDQHAAAGPAATNTSMPNDDPRPTLEERKKLGEWLACGAP